MGYVAEAETRMRFALSLRRSGVTDARVMAALECTPRDAFAPPGMARLAWEDRPIDLGDGARMSRPSDLARLLAALAPSPRSRTLEIGSGSGYATAVLARLSAAVVGVERCAALAEAADARLAKLGLTNARVRHGDGLALDASPGPFDRILLTGSVDAPPAALVARLAPCGRLVAGVRSGAAQRLVLVRKTPNGGDARDLGDVSLDPLACGLC